MDTTTSVKKTRGDFGMVDSMMYEDVISNNNDDDDDDDDNDDN